VIQVPPSDDHWVEVEVEAPPGKKQAKSELDALRALGYLRD
jgi:hypothetical protein